MAQYGTIITNIGLAQIANAQITQTKVGLEYIALGDGNGAHYVPKQNQTALIHEVWRGPIAELSIDPTNSNRIIIDAVIPVTAGGFTIREIGIFDDKNNLIAVGQYPEKYKPQLSEGVSEETLIHFVIETNNADVVKLTIDPTVIIASRNYVDGKVAQVQTALTEHSGQIATTEELGHFKPDGITITVDPVTGVASAAVSNINTKVYTGDLNKLTENGYYSVPANTPNAPTSSTSWLVEVVVSADATYAVQTARHGGSNNLRENVFQRVAVKDESGQFVWGTVASGTSGYLGNWKIVSMNISDAIDSDTPLTGASSKAVKQLNDKIPVDSGYVILPPMAPFVVAFGETARCRGRRLGNVVTIEAWLQVSGSMHSNSIFVLPKEFNSRSDFTFSIRRQRGGNYVYLNGNCNGSGILLATEHMPQVTNGDYLVFNFAYGI